MSEPQKVQPQTIVVLGGGSFATAMATVLARNNHNIIMLSRNLETVTSINENHKNPTHLSTFTLLNNIKASNDAESSLKTANYIVHCVPIQQSLEYLQNLQKFIPQDVPIISTSKGLHVGTLTLMSNLIPNALGRDQPAAFFSGPSFAKELMENMPTAVVVASKDMALAVKVQNLFASATLRVYTSTDIIGVEVGGAIKNVFAMAAGAVEGLGLGINTMAALVTRGCHEMNRLALTMGAQPYTLSGLSGYGDLMLTCFGNLSRNRSVGVRLGKGEKLADILSSMNEVAEGVATAPAALELCIRYNLDLPIIKAVADVVAGKLSAKDAVHNLFTLPLTPEFNYDY